MYSLSKSTGALSVDDGEMCIRDRLKRAGLDYWDKLDVTTYVNFEDFLAKNPGAKI